MKWVRKNNPTLDFGWVCLGDVNHFYSVQYVEVLANPSAFSAIVGGLIRLLECCILQQFTEV